MKKVITVDFDETLAETVIGAWGGTNLIPIKRVIEFVKEHHASGTEIHIVTFRNWTQKKEIQDFCKVYKIPIESITCTEGKNKVPFIQKLNSSLHIDDSVEVCTLCILARIDVLLVDWGQDSFNTASMYMPKI